jgi:1-phosphofructokinase
LPNTFFCLSANPAIDKRIRVPKLEPGAVNRATEAHSAPGGKAAHVAMVLQILGADPLWIGTAGGRTGEELIDGLTALGIRAQPLKVAAETRVNLEIIDEQGWVTELLEPGSALQGKESEDFFSACASLFSAENSGSIVVVSGSLPLGTEQTFYAELTELAHRATPSCPWKSARFHQTESQRNGKFDRRPDSRSDFRAEISGGTYPPWRTKRRDQSGS